VGRRVVVVGVGVGEDRVGLVVVGGFGVGIGRVVVVGGIAAAAAVVEEDGCGLVGGEACVRGAHGVATATATAAAAAAPSRAGLWSLRLLAR
jgi:hypothetical protein